VYNSYVIILIDLDNTIYPASKGVLKAIDRRMSRYMVEKLCIPRSDVDEMRVRYWKTYGTTMRGLRENFEIDEVDFLEYVHNVPVEDLLEPDTRLRRILSSVEHSMYIFTNADIKHAKRVLAALGIADLLDGIFDVKTLNLLAKPDPRSYTAVMERFSEGKRDNPDEDHSRPGIMGADSQNPDSSRPRTGEQFLFLDDCSMYLKPAKEIGWITVHVCEESGAKPRESQADGNETGAMRGGIDTWVDYTIPSVCDLPQLIGEIERKDGAKK